MKKTLRYITRIALVLLILLIVLLAALRLPSVQTFIVSKITNALSQKLDTKLSIDKVNINFVDHVSITGIYIEDQRQDTLLFAKKLEVDIAIFQLLKKEIAIEYVELNKSTIKIYQNPDSTFNFNFIIDAFASEDTTSSSRSFTVDLGTAFLDSINYSFDLLQAKNKLKLQELSLEMEEIDLENLVFAAKTINFKEADISSIWLASDSTVQAIQPLENQEILFPLASLPITVSCAELNIVNTSVLYKKGTAALASSFDPNFIKLQDVNLHVNNIFVNDSIGKLKLVDSELLLNQDQKLESFNLEAEFTPKSLSLTSTPWTYNQSQFDFDVKASYISFQELIELKPNTNFNIALNDLKIATKDVQYFVPQLEEIEALQNLANETIGLQAKIDGNTNNANIESFNLQALNSKLDLNGVLQNFTDVETLKLSQLQFDLTSQAKDVRTILGQEVIPSSYNRFGTIRIEGSDIDGSLKLLEFQKLQLSTAGTLAANISGSLKNLDNPSDLAYNLSIKKLQSSYKDALAFTSEMPSMLSSLELISYVGKAKGDLNTFDLDGKWVSNLGNLKTDLFLDFNADYTNASYKGKIDVLAFDIGRLLDNDSLGILSLSADVDGKGLQLEDIQTILNIDVQEVTFNSYLYQDILVKGALDQQKFDGEINIDDEHLVFDFKGLLDFQDSIPNFNFDAALTSINTQALNLTSFPIEASLDISSDISGSNLEDLDGHLSFSNINLKNEDKVWQEDSIVLVAENKITSRSIKLNSSFLDIDLNGNFEIANLQNIILAFGDQHFPFSTLIGGEETDDAISEEEIKEIKGELVNVDLSLTRVPELAAIFNLDLKRLDSLKLHFSLDAPNNLLDFDFFIPVIEYANIHVDSIYAKAGTENGDLLASFSIDSASYGEQIYIPGLGLDANFKDQKAILNTYIENDTGGYSLNLLTTLSYINDAVGLDFNSPLTLNTREWIVTQNKGLLLNSDSLIIPEISISNQNQELAFKTLNDEYNFDFTNFDINNLVELVEIDSLDISGRINGNLSLNSKSNSTAIAGDLKLNKLGVNDAPIGDLTIKANVNNDMVNAAVNLISTDNNIDMDVAYNTSSEKLNGEVVISKITLSTFEAFTRSFASDLEGYLTGNISISGTTEDPSFDGILNFNETKARIIALGTVYGIKQGQIQLTEKLLSPKLVLVDEANRPANLNGTIEHKLFQDLKFDLSLQTDVFTFLNSPKDAEALFYGKLVGNLQTTIKGGLDMPVIRGNIKTLAESDITVQLLTEKAVANQENYVIFLNGSDYSLEEIDSIARDRYKVNSSLDINVQVEIDDKTKLKLIIDPLTGDNLQLKGNAQLSVKIPPKGDLDITGIYTVDEGAYSFSFQKLLKRKFEIVKGSQIVFSGNPMFAQLNFTASYNTEASLYPLVQESSSTLNSSEETDLKKKTDVAVQLIIDGMLEEPNLSFNIELGSEGNSPIGSTAKRSLDQLIQNESELNKQVFSLLLFNSFSGSTSSGNLSTTGTSTAVRSVGNLISTQLNRLASKADGLQIDFDLDQYQNQLSESNDQITEIELGVSQSLLNDRLVISVGGNVDLESGDQSQSALGNVAGDFVLEYKLSDDGKYKVRVFQKTDYDALNDANLWKTGAGFSYQTKFGKLNQKKQKKK